MSILIVTGFALSSLYRHAVERAFDRRLDVYLRTLVADVASPEEGAEKFPQSIGEPLFELPLVGLVLASHASRYAEARAAFLALAVGFELAAAVRQPKTLPPAGTARATRKARRMSACVWSSATSISATKAVI